MSSGKECLIWSWSFSFLYHYRTYHCSPHSLQHVFRLQSSGDHTCCANTSLLHLVTYSTCSWVCCSGTNIWGQILSPIFEEPTNRTFSPSHKYLTLVNTWWGPPNASIRTCLRLLTCFPSKNEQQLYRMLCTSPFGACGRQNTPSPPPQEGHITVPKTCTHVLFCGKRALCRCDSWFSQRLAWIMTHKNPTESLRILTKRETRGSGVTKKHMWQLKQSWECCHYWKGALS